MIYLRSMAVLRNLWVTPAHLGSHVPVLAHSLKHNAPLCACLCAREDMLQHAQQGGCLHAVAECEAAQAQILLVIQKCVTLRHTAVAAAASDLWAMSDEVACESVHARVAPGMSCRHGVPAVRMPRRCVAVRS
jgi:hypothetical protein